MMKVNTTFFQGIKRRNRYLPLTLLSLGKTQHSYKLFPTQYAVRKDEE
jgi:hypothetical protein